MAIQVNGEIYKVSTHDDLVMRTSQCVLVGIVDSTQNLGGIASIHFSKNHEEILDSLIEELTSFNGYPKNYRIGITGGTDAFIQGGFGFIPGRANAFRVLDYLFRNGLDKTIIKKDIITDYERELTVSPSRRDLYIKIYNEQKLINTL